jgi:protein-tyrosine phosphatase
MSARPIRVLFVCLGNICRSPLAEGVFRHHLRRAGLVAEVEVSSAGTGAWHQGEPPDPRMCATARRRGVDLTAQRARALSAADLSAHDYVLAMDRENLTNIRRLPGAAQHGERIRLFRHFDPKPEDGQVPDPYYGGAEGFDRVYEIVERTSAALLEHLRREHGL